MKALLKILPILMIVSVIFMVGTPVLATSSTEEGSKAGITSGMVGDVSISPKTDSAGAVSGIGNNILGIIRVVGTVIAVGVLMVIGIKYMMGSAEEKAEYKKTMLPYLIGAVVLFAAVQLAAYIYQMATTIA